MRQKHLRAAFCRLEIGDTAQRGKAATKGARVCDPQQRRQPERMDNTEVSRTATLLRLTEPRSVRSSRAATISGDTDTARTPQPKANKHG